MRRGRIAGALTTLVAALSSVAAFSISAAAQGVPTIPAGRGGLATLWSSASPSPPPRSVALGLLSPTADVSVEVALKIPDPSGLSAFIASLSNRGSPNFHRFLSPAQFGRLFGPSPSTLAAVEASLRSEGLRPGPVAADRLMIPVSAPAEVMDRAFHVNLVRYRLPSGRVAFTSLAPPTISSSVAADIEVVTGLNDIIRAQDMLAGSTVPHTVAPRSSSLVHPNDGRAGALRRRRPRRRTEASPPTSWPPTTA